MQRYVKEEYNHAHPLDRIEAILVLGCKSEANSTGGGSDAAAMAEGASQTPLNPDGFPEVEPPDYSGYSPRPELLKTHLDVRPKQLEIEPQNW